MTVIMFLENYTVYHPGRDYEEILVWNITTVEEREVNMTVQNRDAILMEAEEGVEEEEDDTEDIVPDPEAVIDYTDTESGIALPWLPTKW